MSRLVALVVSVGLVGSACAGDAASSPRPTPTPAEQGSLPGRALAFVDDVSAQVGVDGDVLLIVRGDAPTPCHEVKGELSEVTADGRITLDVWSEPSDDVCIQVLDPFELSLQLSVAPGSYVVELDGRELTRFDVGSDSGDGDETDEPIAFFEGIFPATSWEEYERLAARAADEEAQWVLDPELVAGRGLKNLIGREPVLVFKSFGDQVGEVAWHDGRVLVWRAGEGSPWVVTAVEAGSLEVSISDYSGGSVWIGVMPDRDGELAVAVGAFASEWSDSYTARVKAGTQTEIELWLGSPDGGPAAGLVDIRLQADDGTLVISQYHLTRVASIDETS